MNCVECNNEFIQFVTGHNLYCSDCHSIIIKGLNAADVKETRFVIVEENVIKKNENSFDEKKFIESEKYYHSMKWHNKNLK